MSAKEHLKRLRRQLSDAGVFEHQQGAGWRKLALMLLLVGACLTGVVLLPLWAAFLLVPLAAVGATTATMLGHEGGHRAFSPSAFENQALLFVCLPLFSGMSALHWKHKHNQLHHGHPNVVDADPDIELWPMAMSRADYERATPMHRWFQRNMQSWFFWPMSSLISTSMRMPNVPYLIRHARTHGVDAAWYADLTLLTVHHVLWLVLPSLAFGFLPALTIYLTLWGVVGVLLGVIFAPAHIGLPLVQQQESDWLHNLHTTCNLQTPGWLSWMMVGLDHQVEHHIFPTIPHANLRKASVIVSRYCAAHSLPYQTEPYGTALARVTTFMRDAWRTDTTPSVRAEEEVELRQSA